jgi:hypothetical protein
MGVTPLKTHHNMRCTRLSARYYTAQFPNTCLGSRATVVPSPSRLYMRRQLCRLLSAAVTVALVGCATTTASIIPQSSETSARPAHGAFLDAAAVRALYAVPHREDGVVLQGSHKGASWTRWTKQDGTVSLVAGHGLFTDTGRIAVRGNAACWKWASIDEGKESCTQLMRVGADEYVAFDGDGSKGSDFHIVPQ